MCQPQHETNDDLECCCQQSERVATVHFDATTGILTHSSALREQAEK